MKNTLKVCSRLSLAVASISSASLIHAADLENSFFSDSKANLRLRNFYINTDNRDGAGVSKNEEWGQGFMLDFQSGYTPGTLGFGVDALGVLGMKLDDGGRVGKAGEDRQPGSMFPQNSDGSAVDDFSSLGLTAKMKISKTELRYGTLIPKMPVLTSNDGRLLPQTFQGGQITSSDLDSFKFTAGQIERVKSRMSSSNDGLSISGANNTRTGRFSNQFRFAGVDYQASKNLLLQYYYGELEHFYQQHFLGAVNNLALGPGVLKSDFRYFHSTNTDENSNEPAYFTSGFYGGRTTKGEVDNDLWSALFLYNIGGHSVGGGYQRSSGKSDFPWINQGDGSSTYLITESQISKFARAGEDTWQARYGYDFASIGVPGLTAGVIYERGDNIKNTLGDQHEWERDLTLSYVVQAGPLKNLSLSWKNACYRTSVAGSRDQDENRLILGYSIPLL